MYVAPRRGFSILAVSAEGGKNAASGSGIPPPFSSEAAGRNTAAFGLSIDRIAFFSIPAKVSGSSFAAERFLTKVTGLICCISGGGILCLSVGSSVASHAKVEFLTVETGLSSSSFSVVIVVLLDSWQT